jgi:FkbM family methyltransferase
MIYEYCLGWHGIMIEGNPHNFENLISRRPCTQNVWAVSCPPQQSYVIMSDKGPVAEVISLETKNQNPKDFTMLAPCRTMSSVFKEYGVTHINFFSLDVEGHEAAVLSTINFDRVKIDVLITETNRLGYAESPGFQQKNDMVHKILTSAGMTLVPSHVKDLPDCSPVKKRLLNTKFQELEGSSIYVSKEFRDDIC